MALLAAPIIDLTPYTDILTELEAAIAAIPDFPKPGILFRDIMPVLKNPRLFDQVIGVMADLLKDQGIEYVAGIESRGFILGAPLALKLGVGFVPVRKKGKLPGDVVAKSYDLEYGTDTIEVQANAIPGGGRVVLVDDLLATGGTAAAASELLKTVGADLKAILFLIELDFLAGRALLPQDQVPLIQSLIHY